MKTQVKRKATGGRIGRKETLNFTFDGRPLTGYTGDSLASALLANDIHLVARSTKLHRPRGIMAAGVEESSAFVTVGRGGYYTPNCLATRVELSEGLEARSINCWPSLHYDFGSVASLFSWLMPAGFYNKTFMWPASKWGVYERFIRLAAGLSRSPVEPDVDRYEKCWDHFDVVIVGGGPSGLAAALASGRAGANTMLVDDDIEMGGSLLYLNAEIDSQPGFDWVSKTLSELRGMKNVVLLCRTTAFGYYDHNYLILFERMADHVADSSTAGPRHRLWKIRARHVVLTTGALERPLVFANNDRPGVMLASGARSYINRYAVMPGERAVAFTNNDTAYGAAFDLADGGVTMSAIIDLRPHPPDHLVEAAKKRGIEVLGGHAVVRVDGKKQIREIEISAIVDGSIDQTSNARRLACDLLINSGGWNPNVNLFSQSGGTLRYDKRLATFIPDEGGQPQNVAGAANGTFSMGQALAEGFAAGISASEPGSDDRQIAFQVETILGEDPTPYTMWRIPKRRRKDPRFVDNFNDVTDSDIALAVREGYELVEHAKRYTITGLGPDQGRTSNILALGILSEERGHPIEALGTTTFRPPYTPVSFGSIAGREINEFLVPVAMTPLSNWIVENGGMLDLGTKWRYPNCFPREGEDFDMAAKRECLAIRNNVVLCNSSTLGKLDIKGKDSLNLLNMVYTNSWDSLDVGRVRFGVMLKENGTIFDDGVTARLGENHYHMCTSSASVEHVMDWIEELLQCEWPHWEVFVTDVTSQWASITLVGPKARQVLEKVGTDIDLSPDSFPHMAVREGNIAGVSARILRVSFVGELSYEINVPAGFARAIWLSLMNAGESADVTACGVEALDRSRMEKGFILPGQDLDADTTPYDIGIGWVVNNKKVDFIGKRSLERPFFHSEGRKQLVGLLSEEPNEVLPMGSHIVANKRRNSYDSPHVGFVTSSCFSHTLDRSIALALLENGHNSIGNEVDVFLGERTTRAKVTKAIFYDPEGNRLHD
jgi:sarcosine oxidase subunit alpha